MSPESTQRLTRLLAAFDAKRLGDGNVAAGVDVLAAMACSIANIHRRGACLTSPDGSTFHVGTSLLASGPLTSSLIGERVVSVLADIQTNLLDHLAEWAISKQDTIDKNPICTPVLDHFMVKADASSLAVIGDDTLYRNDRFTELFSPFPNQTKRALLGHPLVYVTGATPAELHRNLGRSELGRPLVFDVLRSPSHCDDLGACCLPVIDGSMTSGPLSTSIQGHVLVSDPSRVLDEVVRNGQPSGRWLMRLPWLVDGNPEPEIALNGDANSQLGNIEQRYQLAMHKAWQSRLDHLVTAPASRVIDMTAFQARWVRFLSGNDSSCPGISSAARPLLATLVFGLYEIAKSMETPEGFQLNPADVVVFAGFLAQRMSVAHSTLVHTGEKEEKLRNQKRILEKLTDGPLNSRDLGRKFHCMTTTECREHLHELNREGRVTELSGDRWQLANTPSVPESTSLTLDA